MALIPNTQNAGLLGRRFCLHGLGGVGKTEVALHFAYKHLDQFPFIFWLSADTKQKLSNGIAEAARFLGLGPSGATADPSRYMMLFMDWLQNNGEYSFFALDRTFC